MATDLNTVALTGRLTRDPELRSTKSGTSVVGARLAFSTRQKDGATGEWGEKSNYISLTVWGSRGEAFAKYLGKGSRVAISGRLEWREWESNGAKRQSVEITVDDFTFIDSKSDREDGGGGFRERDGSNPNGTEAPPPATDVPVESPGARDPVPGSGGSDDDIPF